MYQSCQAVGSYLASWIPRARMGLAASERLRTQIKGKCLVPPTTLGAAKGSASASPLRGAPPAHWPLPAPASFVPHQTPPGRVSYSLLSLPPFQGVGLGPRHVLLVVKSRDFSSNPIPLGPSGAIPQETPLPLSSGTGLALGGADWSPCCSARPAQKRGLGLTRATWLSAGMGLLCEGQSCSFVTQGRVRLSLPCASSSAVP